MISRDVRGQWDSIPIVLNISGYYCILSVLWYGIFLPSILLYIYISNSLENLVVHAMQYFYEYRHVNDIHSLGRESKENRDREDILASGSLSSLYMKKGVDWHTNSKAMSSEMDIDDHIRRRHRSPQCRRAQHYSTTSSSESNEYFFEVIMHGRLCFVVDGGVGMML